MLTSPNTLKGLRVRGCGASRLLYISEAGRRRYDGFIGLRQLVPLWQIDQQVIGRAAFPPAWVVIVLHDFVEAELLVVIRPNPLRCIDGALFERRINVPAGD